MEHLIQVLQWLEIALLIFIGIQVGYLLLFSILSLLPHKPKLVDNGVYHKIAVIIPGYKEDRIIVETAKAALAQNYPRENYHVLIAADSFQSATLDALRALDVEVLEVQFENSTKAKSLNKALEHLSEKQFDIAVILDSDNIMSEGLLAAVNQSYNAGFRAIQGHRTAKNQEGSFALLDAINEEIGNSIFRKSRRSIGMSSSLIGSGMAFDFDYFQLLMQDIQDVAGEDKLIELKLLDDRTDVEFLYRHYVYDEKVANSGNFSKQRTRWVGVQLYFLRHYFLDGLFKLFTQAKLDYFDKTFQMALIPKVLLIGLTGFMGIASLVLPLSPYWLYLMLAYFAALFIAIPRRFYNRRLLEAVLHIPKAILAMVRAVLRINKSTASKFEVTEKSVNQDRDQ